MKQVHGWASSNHFPFSDPASLDQVSHWKPIVKKSVLNNGLHIHTHTDTHAHTYTDTDTDADADTHTHTGRQEGRQAGNQRTDWRMDIHEHMDARMSATLPYPTRPNPTQPAYLPTYLAS